MSLYDQIMAYYPEIPIEEFYPETGSILLQDDGDGIDYIAKWDYAQPLPPGMKIGK